MSAFDPERTFAEIEIDNNKRPKLAVPQSWANLSLKLRFPKLRLGVS